jgi:hypothetical protein
VVLGCNDGSVRAHSASTGKLLHHTRVGADDGMRSPVTALRVRASAAETNNVVMFATADGALRYWHATSGNFLGSPVHEVTLAASAPPPPYSDDQVANRNAKVWHGH